MIRMDMLNTEPSLLCGYSYTYWKVGYKPQAFEKLERVLIFTKKPNPESIVVVVNPKYYDLVEQIIDSFGKLGFLFLSRDEINKVNGKIRGSHLYVYYHLYNFIYDCKAYLDAVAVMLNDFYKIGRTKGDIDFQHGDFRDAVIRKAPKLKKIIKQNIKWFDEVVKWRTALIHKFSAPLGTPQGKMLTKEEFDTLIEIPVNMMLVEPQPFLSANFPELIKKHGTAFRDIDPFCEEWISIACDFYNSVCNVIADDLA